MLDQYTRVLKEGVLEPVARVIGRLLSPNQITMVAFVFGLLSAYLAYLGDFPLALACWAANRTLDGLDGTVARLTGRQTDFGGYLDMVTDCVVYSAVPWFMVVGSPSVEKWNALSYLLSSFFVNNTALFMLSSVLEKRNRGGKKAGELTTVTMPSGIVEGTETVLFFTAFLLWPEHTVTLFVVMGSLVWINVVQRLMWARKNIQ